MYDKNNSEYCKTLCTPIQTPSQKYPMEVQSFSTPLSTHPHTWPMELQSQVPPSNSQKLALLEEMKKEFMQRRKIMLKWISLDSLEEVSIYMYTKYNIVD